jgi:hypothetical protein
MLTPVNATARASGAFMEIILAVLMNPPIGCWKLLTFEMPSAKHLASLCRAKHKPGIAAREAARKVFLTTRCSDL